MAFPDRKKLAEVLENAQPAGADPAAAGVPAPPEAGPPPGTPGPVPSPVPQGGETGAMPNMPEVTAVPPEAADLASALGIVPGGAAAIPGEEGMPELEPEEGTVMPGNLTPEEQQQVQTALAMAARRKMMGE